MRCQVRVPATSWRRLVAWLLDSQGPERLAYLLARASVWQDPWGIHTTDLLVRRALPVPDAALTVQSGVRVEVRPQFSRAVLRACYEGGLSLVDVHTHPFATTQVAFSGHDVANMRLTHAEFRAHIPQEPPAVAASLVVGQASAAGAWLDPASGELVGLDGLAAPARRARQGHPAVPHQGAQEATARCPAMTRRSLAPIGDRYDRQVRAFGAEGQRCLRTLTVAVVGAGGAGSLLVEGLAHLGIGRLLIVDPDRLEATNLNRVVGARPADARHGRHKVEIARRLARRIDPRLPVAAIPSSVLDSSVWRLLRCADVLFGAADSDAARWALNLLAVQYAKLYLDVGVEISPSDQGLEVAGHLAAVRHGGPCLRCLHGYDPRAAAAELQPELREAKRASGYLIDVDDEPAPSVIFLNQAVAALALAELVNWVSPWKPPTSYLLLDLAGSRLTPMAAEIDPGCAICGPDGIRGLGDLAGTPLMPAAPSDPRLPRPAGE